MILGPGDNDVLVSGSRFDTLVADGGGGDNVFEEEDNDFGELDLERFTRDSDGDDDNDDDDDGDD